MQNDKILIMLSKPNPKSVAYIGSKKSLVKLGVPKNDFFFTFFALLKSLLFHLEPKFPETHHVYIYRAKTENFDA